MAQSFRPLPVEKVAEALAGLPAFQAANAGVLNSVRNALGRAIASGQDSAQLAQQLSTPGAWYGVDLRAAASSTASAAPQASGAATTQPATPAATPLIVTPPVWAATAAQAAVQSQSALRVTVADRDPAGITSLSLPASVRGLNTSAVYGPITISASESQLSFQKWVIVYIIPVQMVSFVQGTTTLFVAPLAATGSLKTVSLASGSAWVNVASFASGSPADSYAGLTIQAGSISSDTPLSFGSATVTIPAGASVTLNVTPAVSTSSSSLAQVAPPSQITFSFAGGQPATATLTPFSAQFLGQSYHSTPTSQPAVYSTITGTLAFPAIAGQSEFAPTVQAGTQVTLSGSAPILISGWALWVTTTTPGSLGNAVDSGVFYIGFGSGISALWIGLARPEPELGGIVLATTGSLLLWTEAGLAPNTLSQQKFELWTGSAAASTMTSTRLLGSALVYEVHGTLEILELGAVLSANLDRPILADGNPVPAAIPNGLVVITNSGANHRVFAYAAFTAAEIPLVLKANPDGFPMALDNAFLEVSAPLLLVMEAKLLPSTPGAPYISASGALLLGFLFRMEFPFLPDPYTTGPVGEDTDDRTDYGGLLAAVSWTPTGNITTRLADLEHAHPAEAPTNEASSDLTPPVSSGLYIPSGEFQLGISGAVTEPVVPTTPFPFQPLVPAAQDAPAGQTAPTKQTASTGQSVALSPSEAVAPNPPPAPALAPGLRMLDVSTRASQLGVEIIDYSESDANVILTIDGLSARTAAVLAPIITLPAISWEPMYNLSAPEPGSQTNELLYPPNDGPLCAVGVNSVTLVPVSPIQCLGAILAGTQAEGSLYGAVLTLPFGMVAGIAQTVGSKGGPAPSLTQPSFDVPGTAGDVALTGAYQLTLRPPAGNPTAPVFSGATFLRTQDDNPSPGMSYGEQVLGFDVAHIFSTRFTTAASNGVPVIRYDLTGYGASLFSDWTDLNPPDPTDIIQVDFTTTVGRTSHEIVEAQSVIYPWGIKVVRTITIDRLNSGSVQRTDSGWVAASDGEFQYVTTASGKDITPQDVQRGVIDSLLKVKNIQEFGIPSSTPGTSDATGSAGPVLLQPVTFDAEVAINSQHAVLAGGASVVALDQSQHVAVPSTGVIGYIGLTALYHLSLSDLLNFLPANSGGPIQSTLNLGKSDQVFRTVSFLAEPAVDTTLNKSAVVITTYGLPTLPQSGAWTVALQGPGDSAPRALDSTQPVPVVQPNGSPGSPGPETHYADPSDIFRLGASPPAPPAYLYGFLQDVTTQKQFLAQPYITNVTSSAIPKQLSLRQVPSLADPGVLLGAISSFPAIASALPLQGLENLASSLGNQSLSIDKWFDTNPAKVTPLITTSVCVVNLVYQWSPKGPTPPVPPDRSNPSDTNQNIHVTLGNASGPTWSIDIYNVALQLILPPVSSTPALWIEGSFHADADSLPSFPNLQVFYDGPLAPLTKFFATLQQLASYLSPGSSTPQDGGSDGSGLDVHFANGTLTVQDTFALPQIPLGPGYIEDISLDLGASIDILTLDVGFLVGIGSPSAPVHWIVDPLSGTGVLQAGVQNGGLAVLVQLGIGLGLAIDLGIASGGASITIAFQVQVNNQDFELMLLLTGQAQVTVLGGLASASISLTCGLGLEFPLSFPNPYPVTAIGTAAVAIDITICWVISIDFSGSWSFSHTFEVST
jgi:hypothetical protein